MKHSQAIRLLAAAVRVQKAVAALNALPGSEEIAEALSLGRASDQVVASARRLEQAAFPGAGAASESNRAPVVDPERSSAPAFPVKHPVELSPGEAAPPALAFEDADEVPADASAGVQA